MKNQHRKDLQKKELLIIELPEGTADFIVMNTGDRIAVCAFDDVDFCLDVKGISTEYTLLGKPDEIKEEDAMDLVESFGRGKLKRFRGYGKKQFEKTATESLLSAIESVIFWENPYSGVLASEFPTVFEKFESRTFDRNRTLIFVKN